MTSGHKWRACGLELDCGVVLFGLQSNLIANLKDGKFRIKVLDFWPEAGRRVLLAAVEVHS